MFTIRLFSLRIDFRLQKRDVSERKAKQYIAIHQIEDAIHTHRNKYTILRPYF